MRSTGSVALFYMLTEYSIWTIASERQAGGCRQEITGGQFLDGAGGVTTDLHLAVISADAKA